MNEVTRILSAIEGGDAHAAAQLLPLVYDELRQLAAQKLAQEKPGQTLQATALVHEAYLRLVKQTDVSWQNRAHFFGIASQMMRRILVDHARRHAYAKRGGGAVTLALDDALAVAEKREIDLVALDDALEELSRLDPQQGRVVELRFFAGLSIEDTADALGISPATVKRDWLTARVWLGKQLSRR